jgi:tetratricopeptide (TPR) repeat protein
MKLQPTQTNILDFLSIFVTQVKGAIAVSHTDISHISETVLVPLFRVILDYEDLRNLNDTERVNYPGIDLADDKKRVAIQVTASTDNKKLQDTLRKFLNHKLHEKYDRLIVYILTERQKSYSDVSLKKIAKGKFDFNTKKDIWDYKDLYRQVCTLQLDKARIVEELLESNFGSQQRNYPVPAQLPAPIPDFEGHRDVIDRIKTILTSSSPLININGIGGIGKSELALQIANQLIDNFPDGQLFVDLQGSRENSRPISNALASSIQALTNRKGGLPDDLGELTSLFRSLLTHKKMLILLEDAEDIEQIRAFIPPVSSALIVTSRSPIVIPGIKRETLAQLALEDARKLMKRIVGDIADGIADEICRLCGFLPLAIRAAGSLLAVTLDLEPEDYAKHLADERTRLERIGREGVNLSVEASFNLSYAKLTVEMAKAFSLLSVFPSWFDATAEEVICGDNSHNYLSSLVRLGLVGYDKANKRYRLHELVRLFALSKLSPEEHFSSNEHFSSYYQEFLENANNLYLKSGDEHQRGLTLFRVEEENIRWGRGWAKLNSTAKEQIAEICWLYTTRGGNLLLNHLLPQESIEWFKDALAIAEQLGNTRGMMNPFLLLGLVHDDIGEYTQAVYFFEQAIQCGTEEDDPIEIASVYHHLGETLSNLGDLDRAIDCLTWAKNILCNAGRHDLEGKAIMAMAMVHQKNRNTEQAIFLLKGLLSHAREKGDLLEEANALANLSLIGSKSNWIGLREAIQLNEQSLDRFRQLGYRHWEGQALAQLGNLYSRDERHEEGVTKVQESLTIHRQQRDRTREVVSMGILGEIYLRKGDYINAVKTFDEQNVLARHIGDRKSESNSLAFKAQCLEQIGEYDSAIEYFDQARRVDKLSGHLDHEIGVLCSLGKLYEALGQYTNAEGAYNDEIEIAKKMQHVPSILHGLNHLAELVAKQGNNDQALQYRFDSIQVAKNSRDAHDFPEAQFQVASFLAQIGRKADAIKIAGEALVAFEKICKPCEIKVRDYISSWNDF